MDPAQLGRMVANREGQDENKCPLPPAALTNVFYRLETSVANMAYADKSGNYGYIPLPHGMWVKHMRQYASPDKNLLEVGCGIGTKLYLAKEVLNFKIVAGIEIDKHMAKVASVFLDGCGCWSDPDVTIFRQSALSFKHYGEYDIIYAYDPIEDRDRLTRLYTKIKKEMKVGAEFHRANWPNQIEVWRKTRKGCEIIQPRRWIVEPEWISGSVLKGLEGVAMTWDEYHGNHTLSHQGTTLAHIRRLRESSDKHFLCRVMVFGSTAEFSVEGGVNAAKARCCKEIRERTSQMLKKLTGESQ